MATEDKYSVTYMPWDKSVGGKTYRCGKITGKKVLDGSRALARRMKAMGRGKALEEAELAAQIDDMWLTIVECCYDSFIVKTKYAIYQMNMVGQLGANDSIGEKTKVELGVRKRGDAKLDNEKCSFTNEGSVAAVQITSVATVGGEHPGEWQKNKQANAVGSNLIFDEKIGDIVTWESEGLTGEVAVDATAYNCLTMAWDSEWDEFTAGTEITLTFTLHGKVAEATPKTITKTVKVVVG